MISQIMSSGTLKSAASMHAVKKLKGFGRASIPRIAQLLDTSSTEEAALAGALLDELLNDATLPYYLSELAKPNTRIIAGIVQVLSGANSFDPNRMLDLFDHPEVSKPALLQILTAQKGRLKPESLLRQAYKLEHNDQAALFRIIEAAADTSLIPELVNRIDSRDPIIRIRLIGVLAQFQTEAVQRALHKMLADEHKGVRLAALDGLARMDVGMDVEQLCRMISDPDFKIQSKAVDAVVQLNHPDTVAYLLAPLQEESEYVRRAAVEVLNEIASPTAIKDLLMAIKDSDWWVRSRAADALGNIGGSRVVESVIELIKDEDEFVRRTAVEIINATRDERTYETLVNALSDSDWWVRERAIDGLAALGNKKALPVLLKILADPNGDTTSTVLTIKALVQLNSAQAVEPLLRQLQTGPAEVRQEALQALGHLTDEPQADAVIEALNATSMGADARLQPLAQEAIQRINARHASRTGSSQIALESTLAVDAAGAAPVAPATVSAGRDSGATTSIDPSRLKPGDVLGSRYRYLREVGKGAFGTVFLMEDLMINEQIILKFLNPQFAADEGVIKRFIYELRFARRITHPNVIRIFDMISFGESSAISMEYFPSHTLSGEIKHQQPMELERILGIAGDVCEGMSSAHRARVIHRDLKPNNILINSESVVKIVDFGVASATQQTDTRLTKTGLMIGTPTYMTPEQVLGKEIGVHSDIYSLGIILYEMLTGQPPYRGGDSMAIMYQHVQGSAEDPRALNPDIPAALAETVMTCIQTEPAARFRSMTELQQRLTAVPVL